MTACDHSVDPDRASSRRRRAAGALDVALALLLGAVVAPAAEPASSYDIEVRLDPATHTLTGRQTVRWENTRDAPATELCFHLYLNAFASSETTFMRGWWDGASARLEDGDWGWIRVTRMVTAEGADLLPGADFIRPDDDNPEDFTVLLVPLGEEIPPGSGVELDVSFEARLPAVVARTGHADDFHMVAQWFPKLGVFQGADGWSCHQLHAATEFFADFSRYRVSVTLPTGWIVGATGVEVERSVLQEETDEVQRVVYQAERVHDFAWSAAPSELMMAVEADFEPGRDVPLAWLDEASRLLRLSPAELELPPIHLRLLLPRSQEELAERMLAAARTSLAWLGLRYGPYPYPQLTVVSPPLAAMNAWGMEYPTLITTGAAGVMAAPPLSWVPWIESVTVHELAHQYFQGLVATNEVEEPWLDEGMAQYSENLCLEAMVEAGLAPWVGGISWLRDRWDLASRQHPLRLDRPAWRYRTLGDYGDASYTQAALTLRTLEGLLGRDVMARALRSYVERFRFGHPSARDLQGVLEEASGQQLGWFFEQAVFGDATPDWAVVRAGSRRPAPRRGLSWSDGEWREGGSEAADDLPERAEIHVARLGDLAGPVVVEARFADGDVERWTWDGDERWMRWRPETAGRLEQVVVDPDGVWALETRRADNYWRRQTPDEVRRPLWWVGGALQLIASAVLSWS